MTHQLPVLDQCPKRMLIGPCGGVGDDDACEIELGHACVFLDPARQQTQAADEERFLETLTPRRPWQWGSSFQDRLDAGAFAFVAEVNGADSADAQGFVEAATQIAGVADIVSITDHSGANVHMGNVSAVAHLMAAGIETMPTFACRDRNRMSLQGDLLGVASLGVRNALLVTGNHVRVGDSPNATPVFDLDSPRLLAIADGLRTAGRYENGREVDVKPPLFLGSAAHPFAPPYLDRPRQVMRKVAAGADFLITQHIFDLPRWREFLAGVNALRDAHPPFHLLGGVAVLPNEHTARVVNAGLRGFTIPEEVLLRLRQAKDLQLEGILIAAETVRELADSEGVSGCLLAPVTQRTNALSASVEQKELIAAVRQHAGLPVENTALRKPASLGVAS